MIHYFFGLLKYIGKLLGIILLLLLGVVFWFYLQAPVYDFPAPRPFRGKSFYNPYEGLDSLFWRRSNFQVQSRVWGGLTDGRKNDMRTIDSIFRSLKYEVITASDYMKINPWENDKPTYIAVYEHGYGVRKNHQIVIGAKKVDWIDFPIYQSLSHKQYILDVLRDDGDLIYIAHPKFSGGYKAEDMKYLTGYSGIEAVNYFRLSIEHWDTALSAGRYAGVLGDDDTHDVLNPMEVGHRHTYIYSPSLDGDSIIAALKAHRQYAADIYRTREETMEQKIAKVPSIARFRWIRMNGDTIRVAMDKPAESIRFIGQGGKEMARMEGVSEGWYVFRPEDTYIRPEVHFPDKNVFYFNPIVRYDPPFLPGNPPLATVNVYKTTVYRLMLVASLLFIIVNVILLRKRLLK